MKKIAFGILILLLAGSVWYAVSRATTLGRTVDEATRRKILLLTEGTEPRTLDPGLVQGVPEHHIVMSIMEGLVSYNPDDQNKDDPGVADHWEHNADYSVWTFHLRENAKWSNGDPVTAHDFIFAMKRNLTPRFGAYYSDLLKMMIKGAGDYYDGKSKDFGTVGLKAIDDHTLRFDLVGPTPYLLSALENDIFYPVHPATILKFGRMDDRDTKWTLAGNYVGNGPFMLKERKPNDVIQVVRNPNYWDAANVKLNGINFYSIEDYATEERAFRAGQLHLTNNDSIPLDKIPYYRRNYPDLIHISPYLGVYFYEFNVTRKPLDNPKVRQALRLAIDAEAITRNILRAGQRPATGLTPPGLGEYKTLDLLHFDPVRARQLLAEAGFPNGKGFPTFNILINTSEAHRAIAEAIQQMWREELNIRVGIINQEWKVYNDSLNSHNYDIARYAWIGDYMDPSTFLAIWTTGNGNNTTSWGNPAYDQLIAQSAKTGDPAARFQLLHQAEQILLTDLPIIPFYWYTSVRLIDPSVRNWNALALDDHSYKHIDLEPPPPPSRSQVASNQVLNSNWRTDSAKGPVAKK